MNWPVTSASTPDTDPSSAICASVPSPGPIISPSIWNAICRNGLLIFGLNALNNEHHGCSKQAFCLYPLFKVWQKRKHELTWPIAESFTDFCIVAGSTLHFFTDFFKKQNIFFFSKELYKCQTSSTHARLDLNLKTELESNSKMFKLTWCAMDITTVPFNSCIHLTSAINTLGV